MVSFSLFREGLDILLLKYKKNLILFFQYLEFYLLSSRSNSCFLFRPNFLMFLDHRVSCDQKKVIALEKLTIKRWPQKVGRIDS